MKTMRNNWCVATKQVGCEITSTFKTYADAWDFYDHMVSIERNQCKLDPTYEPKEWSIAQISRRSKIKRRKKYAHKGNS